MEELRRLLEAEVPEGLSVLDADELTALAEIIRQAQERQAEELRSAAHRALDRVPALLRGPLRRFLS